MVQNRSLGRWLAEAALTRRWSDVTIQASGREYRAHRAVLSCASPFMRGLLLSLPNEDAPTAIVLADFSAETVEALLQYVYRGEVRLAAEQLEGFMALAKALQVHIDKRHVDGMHHRFQQLLVNTACKKCEITPTDFLVTTDLIVDDGATRDISMDRNPVNISPKCLTLREINSYGGLKAENHSKNVDVEILIKSDKISKNPATCLPLIRNNALKPLESDNITVKKYKQCFLKDILVSKGKVCGKNVPYENISMSPEQKNVHILTDSSPCKEKILKRDINNFSTFKTASVQHFLIEKNNGYQIDKSDFFHEENYSNVSCEIFQEENEREFDKSKTHVRASPQKGYYSIRKENGCEEDPVKNLSGLSANDSKAGQNSIALNLVNNQKDIFRVSPFDLSTYSYKVPWIGFDEDELARGITKRGFGRNDKLVRPIPSLMPIRDFQSAPDYRKVQQDPQTLLDLTTFKSVNLVRNSKSAFYEVGSAPGPCGEARIKSHSESFPKVNDVSRTYRVNTLRSPQPLRFGFSVGVDEKTRTIDKSLNTTQHCLLTSPSDNYNHRRRIPNNKVLASPWSGRCPVYYRREEKKVYPVKQVSCDAKNISRSSESVLTSATSEDATELSSLRHRGDWPVESNIDSTDSNGNGLEVNGVHSELRSTALPTDTNERVDHFELTKIPNDSRPIAASHRAQKTPQHIDDKSSSPEENPLNANLIRSIVTIPAILPEDACALKCEVCSKMFTSRATLALHAGGHASRARYKCEQCDKCFSQLRNYKYHVSVHKGTREFAATCNVCGKYFNDRGYLSSHMKIHRNRKEYQCPHCPKSFNQRVAYNMHVRIHTGVKPHQCEECGKAFSRKMLLKQHARTHSGEKPYSCSACGKRFADRSNMTLHMRLHSGVKPFSCTLCPKSFTKKHHLKTHLNYHTGNKPYSCCKCGLTFSQSSNMRTHMKKCSAPGSGSSSGSRSGSGSVEVTLDRRQTDQPLAPAVPQNES